MCASQAWACSRPLQALTSLGDLNKAEPLPWPCLCFHDVTGTMSSSDSFSARGQFHHFRLICLCSTSYAVQRKVSPVPDHTLDTCRFLYTVGFFDSARPSSSCLPWSSPICPGLDFPSFHLRGLFDDTAVKTSTNIMPLSVKFSYRSMQ